ncbi:hypothetical protein HH212_12195 [Massilia forsythiae]|uniref:DUF7738 domain-containing protein n=1 Tax=Massilia forsythiae TaxID=2728020 RepID=A0A7Z2ZU51_9BURK|nr:hypothetical protein [Massilia forsythiae]QJE00687.1 hypothetical protein HH212_12195 [Massilia forsythiae]
MMKIFLRGTILVFSLFAPTSKGAEPSDQSISEKKREPTMLDRWNEIKHQAALATGAITALPQPRHVKRQAKPEIIIKGSNIFFDGKPLEFGWTLASWKSILKRNPHCDKTEIVWCVWEDLGLEVSTRAKSNFGVSTIVIKLSIPEHLLHETRTPYPDGTPDNTPKADWLARHPFTGYLEIDGFGIDKETKFWELQSSIDVHRNLSCGLTSCEFPSGIFGPKSTIDLHLNGGSESATIEEIKIYTTSR